MAIVRFDTALDPISSLLNLQGELERYMRNPAFVTGPAIAPPLARQALLIAWAHA